MSDSNCCDFALQTGAKITAAIQISWSAVKIYILLTRWMNVFGKVEDPFFDSSSWVIFSIVLASSLITFAAGILLMVGAFQSDLKKVSIWLRTCSSVLLVEALILILTLFEVGYGSKKLLDISSFLISSYCVISVYFFKVQVLENPRVYHDRYSNDPEPWHFQEMYHYIGPIFNTDKETACNSSKVEFGPLIIDIL